MYITTIKLDNADYKRYQTFSQHFFFISTYVKKYYKKLSFKYRINRVSLPSSFNEYKEDKPEGFIKGLYFYYNVSNLTDKIFYLHNIKLVNTAFIFDDKHYVDFPKLYELYTEPTTFFTVYCDIRCMVVNKSIIFKVVDESIKTELYNFGTTPTI